MICITCFCESKSTRICCFPRSELSGYDPTGRRLPSLAADLSRRWVSHGATGTAKLLLVIWDWPWLQSISWPKSRRIGRRLHSVSERLGLGVGHCANQVHYSHQRWPICTNVHSYIQILQLQQVSVRPFQSWFMCFTIVKCLVQAEFPKNGMKNCFHMKDIPVHMIILRPSQVVQLRPMSFRAANASASTSKKLVTKWPWRLFQGSNGRIEDFMTFQNLYIL